MFKLIRKFSLIFLKSYIQLTAQNVILHIMAKSGIGIFKNDLHFEF
ncbi:hypothetical protein ACQKJN_07475 [Staphylococcus saprophyticus]|nr:hypothetical protein [Staphylococcus saprophyticus]MDW4080177.1 hypothetical protein [Staphylococcus saprophyticus]